MKPDKPRTWLNPQSSSFDQDIQALGGTIIHLQTTLMDEYLNVNDREFTRWPTPHDKEN